MLTNKEQRHVQDRLANLRARITGLQHYLMQLNSNAASDLEAMLQELLYLLQQAEKLAELTPQQRVAMRLEERLGYYAMTGVKPPPDLEDAVLIARDWPWNTTSTAYWAERLGTGRDPVGVNGAEFVHPKNDETICNICCTPQTQPGVCDNPHCESNTAK